MKRTRHAEDDDNASSASDQDVATALASKIVTLDNSDTGPEATTTATTVIQCSLPGHTPGLRFSSYRDYEGHYNTVHTNRCLECRRNFPTSHVLDLHILEQHDALAKIRREKGEPIYACFVETCGERFKGIGKRQDHLIMSHKYPANYFFAVTKFGIDGRKSMLVDDYKHRGNWQKGPRGRKPNKANGTGSRLASKNIPREAEESRNSPDEKKEATGENQETPGVDAQMEDLAGAMSALRFVPRAIRLGPKHKAEPVRR
ncbi:hypothetical protein M406DRAFT_32736 [Cryphonectria parasitica EP155]|uniref:C2H2-type domain-containing protein n=1 Tax=Cryphonectria parasitica (strain ATCC 38755 / EP155) TaxID=660469 RepID=A0A9P4YG11_CRYP1|nr:uncharacterized protein M406DRAFT_32736 [Cryphonectria parasitica EP155]KAF3771435.1 hypothetical protein M406DRAFT_32736 [Cryphonectria parasitica EP155]